MEFLTVPSIMQCLVCRGRIDAMTPYPQLCDACRKKPSRSLVATMYADVDRLAKAWGALVTPALEPRFIKVLEAASDLDLPMTWYRRAEAQAKFQKRIIGTIELGDDFAKLCKAWWQHRIRKDDLRALELQLAWAKIQGDDNAPQSKP
jgi:hypothetical protein